MTIIDNIDIQKIIDKNKKQGWSLTPDPEQVAHILELLKNSECVSGIRFEFSSVSWDIEVERVIELADGSFDVIGKIKQR